MARAHYVAKARKARPEAGIAVGDAYYWWQFRYGGKRYSKTRPRPSQLTNSDKLSRAYAAQEALEDLAAGIADDTTLDDLRSELDNIASEINDVAQEYRSAKENMPENFQDGEVANQCEENADNLESWASDVEGLADSWDEEDFDPADAHRDIETAASNCPL